VELGPQLSPTQDYAATSSSSWSKFSLWGSWLEFLIAHSAQHWGLKSFRIDHQLLAIVWLL